MRAGIVSSIIACLLFCGLLLAEGIQHKSQGSTTGGGTKATLGKDRLIKAGAGGKRALIRVSKKKWSIIKPGLTFPVGSDIITTSDPHPFSENGVTVTVLPWSHVRFEASGLYTIVFLDPFDLFRDSAVKVEETRAVGLGHKWLSFLRVRSRNENLTLGGHGTTFVASQHFKDPNKDVLDGIDVNEKDAVSMTKSWVESYLGMTSTTMIDTITAGQHRWFGFNGKAN